ncbi:MAG: hypothetical protein ACOCQ9_02415 [Candidatus Brocadiia bacterium]
MDADAAVTNRRGSSLVRKVVVTAIALIFLSVAAISALPVLSPFFASPLAGMMGRMIGREVQLDHLSVNLLRSRAHIAGLTVMEEDGETEFVGIDRMEAQFSLGRLIKGDIGLPAVRVDGLRARVVADEHGVYNYQSILEEDEVTGTEGEETAAPPAGREPKSIDLPEVFADILVSDVRLSYRDARKARSAELTTSSLHCSVEGLDDIVYESEGGRVELIRGDAITADGRWAIRGESSLRSSDNELSASSRGRTRVKDISVKRAGDVLLDEEKLTVSHDMNYVRDTELTIDQFQITSSFADMEGEGLRFPDPVELGRAPAGGGEEAITPAPEGEFGGQLVGSIDLMVVAPILDFLTDQNPLERSDGRISWKLSVVDVMLPRMRLRTEVDSGDMTFVLRRLNGGESVPVTLGPMQQEAEVGVDMATLQTDGWNELSVAGAGSEEDLFRMRQEWESVPPSSGAIPIPLENLKSEIDVALEPLTGALAGLLPEGFELTGRFSSMDALSRNGDAEFRLAGTTELSGRLAMPDAREAVPVGLESDRNVAFGFKDSGELSSLDVRRLDLKMPGQNLFDLDLAGRLDFTPRPGGELKGRMLADLSGATPYLRAFGLNADLDGGWEQTLLLSGGSDELRLESGGRLVKPFSCVPEGGEVRFSTPLAVNVQTRLENVREFLRDGDTELLRVMLESTADAPLVVLGEGDDPAVSATADLRMNVRRSEVQVKDLRIDGRWSGENVRRLNPDIDDLLHVPVKAAGILDCGDGEFGLEGTDLRVSLEEPVPHGEIAMNGSLKSVSLAELPRLLDLFDIEEPAEPQAEDGGDETPDGGGEVAEVEPVALPMGQLNGLRLSMQGAVDSVDMGEDNVVEGVTITGDFDGPGSGHPMECQLTGRINPGGEDEGELDLKVEGEVDGDNVPHFTSRYEVQKFPVTDPMIEAGKRFAVNQYTVPLLGHFRFATSPPPRVGVAGALRWSGMQWEPIRRSMVSDGPVQARLPGGKFSMDVALTDILNRDVADKVRQEGAEPQKEELQEAKERRETLQKRLGQVNDALKDVRGTLLKLQKRRDELQDMIDAVRPLAAFSGDAEEKLEELEDNLDSIAGRVEPKKDDLSEKKEKQNDLQQRVEAIKERINELEDGLQGAGLLSATGLAEHLNFSYEAIKARVEVTNDNPWEDADAGEFSRISLDSLAFEPEGADLPEFGGWIDLGGNYQITIIPSEHTFDRIGERSRLLADVLREQGVTLTPEGVSGAGINEDRR